jgi:hypothetical protein
MNADKSNASSASVFIRVHLWAALCALLLALVLASPARADASLRTIGSQHYQVHTDLDDDFAHDLARRMDAMYEEYSRRLASFKAEREVPQLHVYLFARQDDYLKFTGERLKNTGGVYIPRRNLLAAFLEGQGRDGLRRTLQHEAFHQFAYVCISPNVPVWLNEGLAQLFEEGIYNGGSFWLGQAPPRRIRQLRADLANSRIIDFEKFLSLTNEQWAANLVGDHDLGATEYNQSWAMVYFLAHARDKAGKERYRTRLIDMLRLLHDGKDGDAAFREAFSDNVRGFQSRFTEFANTLDPTAEATMMDRQSVLGDLLGELARHGKRFTNLSQFKRAALLGGYRMHYTKGELQWDSEPDLKVYFADVDGNAMPPEKLFFENHASSPLPDIVCHCSDHFQLRTRFFRNGDKIEHEVLVEAPGATRAKAE